MAEKPDSVPAGPESPKVLNAGLAANDPKTSKACAMCNEPSTQRCKQCQSTRYCSTQCQKDDWPLHKLLCKSFENFRDTRPSTHHKRAIYFPETGDQPVFAWIYVEENGGDIYALVFGEGVSETPRNIAMDRMNFNCVLNRRLEKIIELKTFRDNMTRGKNQSLLKVNKELSESRRGPILAVGLEYSCNYSAVDLDPMDLRHIVDNLRVIYDRGKRLDQEGARSSIDGVPGVRINCMGDVFLSGAQYEAINIPASQRNTMSQYPTPICQHIGLPLVIHTIPPTLAWRGRHISPTGIPQRTDTNRLAKILVHSAAPLAGSVAVFRKDGRALLPGHLRALVDYSFATFDVRDVIGKDIFSIASKKTFLIYFEKWRAEELGGTRGDLVSPYDV